MRRIALAICAFVMVFALSACGNSVTSGTVTGKHYTPYKHWTTMGGYAYTCLPGFDGKMDCKYKYSPYVVEDHYQNECYGLDLRNSEGNTGSVCVSPREYDNISVGEQWQ